MSSFRAAAAALVAAAAALAPTAHAQVTVRRGGAAPPPTSTVAVALTAGGRRFDATGPGHCQHAPRASIYDHPAAMWTVQFAPPGDRGSVALTLWRPAAGDGATQFSLAVESGATAHRIATVKGGTIVGAGTVTLRPAGDGGAFTIDGTTASGTAIRGTIRCARFAPLADGVGG